MMRTYLRELYVILHVPDKDRSNITLTDSTGFIKSPHYPLSYPHNIDYIYALDVNRTNTVGLYFYSFNVEGTSHTSSMDSCHYDWLMVSSFHKLSMNVNKN